MAQVEQRKNGTWRAKIRKKGWPETSKTFDTKDDANKWARAVEREQDIGAFINRNDAERTAFKEAALRYKKEILSTKRGVQQGESLIKKLVEEFGKYSLASISPALLSAYRDRRIDVVSAQTVVHELNMVGRIFKAAALDWGIALPQGIPTALVRKPKINNVRERRLEPGEWELLKASLTGCKSKLPLAIVEFALETAARQSEIVSLTWQDVDLKKQTARIRGKDGGVTKNNDAYRDLPLSTKAVAVLTGLPRSIKGRVFNLTQNSLKLSWQRSLSRARKSYVHHQLRAALAETGVESEHIEAEIRAVTYHKKKPSGKTIELLEQIEASDTTLTNLRFHDLRHEATSRLAEKLQMHELMKVTGHKSTSMLARYYHPRATDLAAKLG